MTGDRQIQNAYDESTECKLIFHCEELGRFALRASRRIEPCTMDGKTGKQQDIS